MSIKSVSFHRAFSILISVVRLWSLFTYEIWIPATTLISVYLISARHQIDSYEQVIYLRFCCNTQNHFFFVQFISQQSWKCQFSSTKYPYTTLISSSLFLNLCQQSHFLWLDNGV